LVAHQYKGDYEVREPSLVEYLNKMKQLTSQLQSFTVELVPRGENMQADALSRLASSTLQDLKRSVFVDVLPRRSTEADGEYAYQTGPPPQWMTKLRPQNKQILNSLHKSTLWSLSTTKRESTWQTPFRLVYVTEALMPVEMESTSLRVQMYQGDENDIVMAERLDLVEEVREQVALKMQAYLGKVAKHYNRWVKIRVLQIGDLVLRKAAVI
ncbi:Ribonuclease HI, partial [Bienertia sinuspersici]